MRCFAARAVPARNSIVATASAHSRAQNVAQSSVPVFFGASESVDDPGPGRARPSLFDPKLGRVTFRARLGLRRSSGGEASAPASAVACDEAA